MIKKIGDLRNAIDAIVDTVRWDSVDQNYTDNKLILKKLKTSYNDGKEFGEKLYNLIVKKLGEENFFEKNGNSVENTYETINIAFSKELLCNSGFEEDHLIFNFLTNSSSMLSWKIGVTEAYYKKYGNDEVPFIDAYKYGFLSCYVADDIIDVKFCLTEFEDCYQISIDGGDEDDISDVIEEINKVYGIVTHSEKHLDKIYEILIGIKSVLKDKIPVLIQEKIVGFDSDLLAYKIDFETYKYPLKNDFIFSDKFNTFLVEENIDSSTYKYNCQVIKSNFLIPLNINEFKIEINGNDGYIYFNRY